MTRRGPGRATVAASVVVALALLAQCSVRSERVSTHPPQPTPGLGGSSSPTSSGAGKTPPTATATTTTLRRRASTDPGGLHETFDGLTLDSRHWATCYWWADAGCTILSNNELEWYQPGQVQVRDGALHLTVQSASSSHLGRGFDYISGMVSTGRSGNGPTDVPRYAFTYGTVSVRFRTPRVRGLWPAIWMLPASNQSRPEVDLIEEYGLDVRHAAMNLHSIDATGQGVDEGRDVTTPDLSVGWHTIELEWTPGRLRWILDGTERYRIDSTAVPHEPMYLIVNLAAGGVAGAVDNSRLPAELLVDQVDVAPAG
ncbi:MAG: hypothetical protein JWN46_2468 [Acidimicrobiales bacterium]|nr:hypothetical protein [Acidimicrobiales bacterium]